METMADDDSLVYCLRDDTPMNIILLGENGCEGQCWELESEGETAVYEGDRLLLLDIHETRSWDVAYHGCDKEVSFHISAIVPDWEAPEPLAWKRWGETLDLWGVEAGEPGTYAVTLGVEGCSDSYPVEVRDNVEILNVTVDLATDKHKVSWRTAPEQEAYISQVKVYRENGSTYTMPYTQGCYQHGAGNAAETYRIVGVTTQGVECPLPSYQRGTIHTDYQQDGEGNLTLLWNIPYLEPGTRDTLEGFQICQYNPATQEVTAVAEVDAATTTCSCSLSQFMGSGVAVVAAVFASGERSFSNRYTFTGLEEDLADRFKLYPNPTRGSFTVEGTRHLTITNALGQNLHELTIDGPTTLVLSKGLYFVKSGEGVVRKLVVD